MQPPENPYNQPAYNQQFPQQPGFGAPPQTPRGKVSIEVISEAWGFLSPNIGPWILAVVAYGGIVYAISIVQNLVQSLGQRGGSPVWTIVSVLIQLVSYAVSYLLAGGLARMAIGTVRTRTANINEMFSVTNVGVALVVSAILQALLYLLACLPGLAVLGYGVFPPLAKAGLLNPALWTTGKPPALPPALISSVSGGFVRGLLLMGVAVLPLRALFFLSNSLLVDRRVGPWAAIAQSAGALKKHFGMALLLVIVMDLVNTAGFLACCVGYLFAFPLTQIATALVYRDLFGLGEAAPQGTIYAPPPIANPNF